MSYAEEFDSELDSDPDDAKKKNKANIAVALMDSTAEMDDEVEKVLGHRSGLLAVACTHTYPQPLPPTPPAPISNPPHIPTWDPGAIAIPTPCLIKCQSYIQEPFEMLHGFVTLYYYSGTVWAQRSLTANHNGKAKQYLSP